MKNTFLIFVILLAACNQEIEMQGEDFDVMIDPDIGVEIDSSQYPRPIKFGFKRRIELKFHTKRDTAIFFEVCNDSILGIKPSSYFQKRWTNGPVHFLVENCKFVKIRNDTKYVVFYKSHLVDWELAPIDEETRKTIRLDSIELSILYTFDKSDSLLFKKGRKSLNATLYVQDNKIKKVKYEVVKRGPWY